MKVTYFYKLGIRNHGVGFDYVGPFESLEDAVEHFEEADRSISLNESVGDVLEGGLPILGWEYSIDGPDKYDYGSFDKMELQQH